MALDREAAMNNVFKEELILNCAKISSLKNNARDIVCTDKPP